MPHRHQAGFDFSLRIDVPAAKVLAAFFDARALAEWWDVANVIATPRPLGVYAIEWNPTDRVDDLVGRLGGVFHGTVIDFRPRSSFFVADCYYMPPEAEPIGPMALEVTCSPIGAPPGRGVPQSTLLRVVQRGLDDSPRWLRYYELLNEGWPGALETMKAYLEKGRGVWDLRGYE